MSFLLDVDDEKPKSKKGSKKPPVYGEWYPRDDKGDEKWFFPWSDEDQSRLMLLAQQGKTVKEMATTLKRSEEAIKKMLRIRCPDYPL